MPKNGSNADKLDTWHKLVTIVFKNQAELPDFEPYRGPLEAILLEARARGAERQSQVGLKQQETVDFQDLLRQGEVFAGKLRAALRAHYGFQSERLREYGILPIPARRRRSSPSKPEPQEPESPEPQAAPAEGAPETAKASKPEGPVPTPEQKPAPQKS